MKMPVPDMLAIVGGVRVSSTAQTCAGVGDGVDADAGDRFFVASDSGELGKLGS
jgi:hypothetical protein